jgi:hypothetical protein
MFPRTYGTFHLVPLVDWLGPSQPLNRGASAPKHPWIVEHPKRLLCGRGCRAPVASGTVDTYAMLALFTGVQLIPSSYPPTVGVRGSTPAVDCSPKPHRGAGIASISQLLHDKIRFRDATRQRSAVALRVLCCPVVPKHFARSKRRSCFHTFPYTSCTTTPDTSQHTCTHCNAFLYVRVLAQMLLLLSHKSYSRMHAAGFHVGPADSLHTTAASSRCYCSRHLTLLVQRHMQASRRNHVVSC